ncbi:MULTISPECIES: septum formation family protein [unclassified Saccharopolyspora]|uniref:septum formation family protein n=1 Tax=unclassified Saccharopolyspora TaxID=2646250 RepID=UPI001CD7E9B1|nr:MULTISPECIES: septum formation family protein [unclassified Saccharopolyspora]MCA1187826.1 septum formation family protein [Saccharopolyspora sp. 6T]MCA1193812.1 septum formation family protein [Saccharopolyspora sp. 6V]MCA1227019.1 septum formation family protein [Saccharopolyspora sp. 6M]MCA1281751.1 septum formation family protein [Saccharopolyspora sp. 7B]
MAERSDPQKHRRKKPNTRLVMIAAAIGGALVLLISALLNTPGQGGSGIGGPGREGAAPATPPVFEAEAGTCLHWTEADAADIRQVKCRERHLFEVTGKADLKADFAGTAPYPSAEQWQQLKQERCTAVSAQYLRGRLDPEGRFSVGAFTPSEKGWGSGDRMLHCGLQQPGPSGELFAIKGKVAEQDQSNTYEVGRCLGINGTEVWDPVDCAQPHSVEVTGVVDLGQQFPADYPAEDDQDGFLATRCGELAAEYAGSPTAVQDKKLVPYWDTLSEESWNAGSRQVNCKVSAQLPDGSGLAPITGSVKGDVQVGAEPAPQNTAPIQPGVPASGER